MNVTRLSFHEPDERGILTLLTALTHAAMIPGPVDPANDTAKPKLGLFERFDRWAAAARQRECERWLARSGDVFELERRIRDMERRSYFC